MDEQRLLELFLSRDENAVSEAQRLFGGRCRAVAVQLLGNAQDADETVNDALLRAWQHIPPDRPKSFAAYLSTVTRRLAVDRLRAAGRLKRGGDAVLIPLSELSECIPSPESVELEADRRALAGAVMRFLETQSKTARVLFLRRYWAMCSVQEIAREYGLSEGTVKSSLKRTRDRLRGYLEEEGYL